MVYFLSAALLFGSVIGAAKAAKSITQSSDISRSYSSLGCFPDSAASRDLRATSFSSSSFTTTSCFNFCASAGYQYAGLEYGRECYCDFKIHNNPVPDPNYDLCSITCTGEPGINCGGANRLQIFIDPEFLPPTIPSLVFGYIFTGCYTDIRTDRTLNTLMTITQPHTVETCISACSAAEYTYAGVEYAGECYCGNTIGGEGTLTDAGSCDIQCTGDSHELCGGSDRIQIYRKHA